MPVTDQAAGEAVALVDLLHGVQLELVGHLPTTFRFTIVALDAASGRAFSFALHLTAEGRCLTESIDSGRVYDGAIEADSRLLVQMFRGVVDIGTVSTFGKLQGSMASQSLLISITEATVRRSRLEG